jgi:hypothetical protein
MSRRGKIPSLEGRAPARAIALPDVREYHPPMPAGFYGPDSPARDLIAEENNAREAMRGKPDPTPPPVEVWMNWSPPLRLGMTNPNADIIDAKMRALVVALFTAARDVRNPEIETFVRAAAAVAFPGATLHDTRPESAK